MSEFGHRRTGQHLGATAPPMLVDEPPDHAALHEHGSEHGGDRELVPVPQARLAKINLTAGRQVALADPPALQFAPVILRCSKLADRSFDVRSFLATQNANS